MGWAATTARRWVRSVLGARERRVVRVGSRGGGLRGAMRVLHVISRIGDRTLKLADVMYPELAAEELGFRAEVTPEAGIEEFATAPLR